MNLFLTSTSDVPQTEEARTEALELMSVKHNLVTPRNGDPVIAAIQDFITASYLLSRKDTFLDRRQFTQICCYLGDADLQIDIPPPTIWKPQRLWTGKQIFGVLMRPNKTSHILVNVESKCNKWEEAKPENYPSRMIPANDLSPNDGWLVVVNSEIMCGVMDKATVGSGKKKSIFGIILRDYGPHEAAAAMNRLAKLCSRYLGMRLSGLDPGYSADFTLNTDTANYGFSLGINDVIPGPELKARKESLVEKAYTDCQDLIALAKKGKLENKPGCNQEETLEALISSVLSKVREAVGQICMKELSRHNAPLIMATCGSKGMPLMSPQLGEMLNVF
jgi:DNA-directed RNA polymerase III subunit RPC1